MMVDILLSSRHAVPCPLRLHAIQRPAINLRHFRVLHATDDLAHQWRQQLKDMHGGGALYRCDVARYADTVAAIDALGPSMAAMSDAQLAAQTSVLRQRLATGVPLDALLVEAFAVVREAASRVVGQRHFLVQLCGGIVLHEGNVAEMATGEGKTLVATLPAYLHALKGAGVHILTTNDYLARRDAQSMGRIFEFLGMSVGFLPDVAMDDVTIAERQAAVDADVTYSTAQTIAFTFLDDMFTWRAAADVVLRRPLAFAIVDEADSILIDRSVEPHVLSGAPQGGDDPLQYRIACMVAQGLRVRMEQSDTAGVLDGLAALRSMVARVVNPDADRPLEDHGDADAVVYRQSGYARLTIRGAERVVQSLSRLGLLEDQAGTDSSSLAGVGPGAALWHGGAGAWGPYITSALVAQHLLEDKVDYLVDGDEVVLLDRSTGRAKPRTRLQAMLHQSLEAKHNVPTQPLSSTHASVSLQALIRMYSHVSGMTGTASPAAAELDTLYGLSVVRIPPNRPLLRVDAPTMLFRSFPAKLQWLLRTVQAAQSVGQPVLLGTSSVTESEVLTCYLSQAVELNDGTVWQGVEPRVLNATPALARQEARIIAQAGMPGAVTVATNMAGRGTDILLGGAPKWCTLMALENLLLPSIIDATSRAAWQANDLAGAGVLASLPEFRAATPSQLLSSLLLGPRPRPPQAPAAWPLQLLEELRRAVETAEQLGRQVAESRAREEPASPTAEGRLALEVAVARGDVGLPLAVAQQLMVDVVELAEGRFAAMRRAHESMEPSAAAQRDASPEVPPWGVSTMLTLVVRHGQLSSGLERSWDGLLRRQLLRVALLLWCWFDYACRLWRAQVLQAGGLLVVGTSLQENARVEQQLRGRAGRQGEPGSSQVVLDLQDPRLQPVPSLLLGMAEGAPDQAALLQLPDMRPLLGGSSAAAREVAEREQRAALSELDDMVDRFRRHVCTLLCTLRTGSEADRRRMRMQAARGAAQAMVAQHCDASLHPQLWQWAHLDAAVLACTLGPSLGAPLGALSPVQAAVRESLTGGCSQGLQLDADLGAPLGAPRGDLVEALAAGRPLGVLEGAVGRGLPWYKPSIRDQGRYAAAVLDLERWLAWLLLAHVDNAVAAVIHAKTREWRTRLASDGDYQPRAASSAAPDDCSSPVFVEYSQHAAQGMHEALQAAMYMQVVNGWSTFAEELEELRMRTNFVAFTFANPRTEFQWEASRLFDTLLRLLPLAIVQACQQAALTELTRAVEDSGLVLRHPSARRGVGYPPPDRPGTDGQGELRGGYARVEDGGMGGGGEELQLSPCQSPAPPPHSKS